MIKVCFFWCDGFLTFFVYGMSLTSLLIMRNVFMLMTYHRQKMWGIRHIKMNRLYNRILLSNFADLHNNFVWELIRYNLSTLKMRIPIQVLLLISYLFASNYKWLNKRTVDKPLRHSVRKRHNHVSCPNALQTLLDP